MGGAKSKATKPEECGSVTKKGKTCRRIIQSKHREASRDEVCFDFCWQHQKQEIEKWLAKRNIHTTTFGPLNATISISNRVGRVASSLGTGTLGSDETTWLAIGFGWNAKHGATWEQFLYASSAKSLEGQRVADALVAVDSELRKQGFTVEEKKSGRTYNLHFPRKETGPIVDLFLFMTRRLGEAMPPS